MLKENDMLKLGTMTPWGKVAGVGVIGGERYYWLVDRDILVSMLPARMVEVETYLWLGRREGG